MKVADNQRVSRVVKLLEQVAEKNRHRKQQHLFGHTAHCQQIFTLVHKSRKPFLLFVAMFPNEFFAPHPFFLKNGSPKRTDFFHNNILFYLLCQANCLQFTGFIPFLFELTAAVISLFSIFGHRIN